MLFLCLNMGAMSGDRTKCIPQCHITYNSLIFLVYSIDITIKTLFLYVSLGFGA